MLESTNCSRIYNYQKGILKWIILHKFFVENHLSFHTYWLYLASPTLRNWYFIKCMGKARWMDHKGSDIVKFVFFLFCFYIYCTTMVNISFNFTENPPFNTSVMFYYLQVGKGKVYCLKLNINLICKQGLQNYFWLLFQWNLCMKLISSITVSYN